MSVYPCSRHRSRTPGRLASFYWAWFLADGTRVAYKERICLECTKGELALLLANSTHPSDAVSQCPACGIDSADNQDAIFLTLYAPKLEPKEFQLPTCAPCAVTIRVRIQENADKLPDRGADIGGPQPPNTDAWTGFLE
jgi:hypothetical protein